MQPNPRQPRIVLAEDDHEMRKLLCELLARLPVSVDSAASGADLVVLLADDRPVDLLITDVRMPWMTGYQVAISARNSGLRMPIIVVTAFPDEGMRSKVEKLGSAVMLAKPFHPEELLSLVRARLFQTPA